MRVRNGGYFIREALNSMYRNRILSLATISTVSICIFILGSAALMALNASNFMNRLESDVEMVAFIDKTLSSEQVQDIRYKIDELEGIESIQFVSKDDALKRLEEKYAGQGYNLADTIEKNPLPDSYEIKAQDPHQVEQLAQKIKRIEGIYKVNYGQGIVERLFSVTRWVRTISMGMMIFLVVGAVFLIATSIRLAIFARRKEIYLMKLVGAKDWFIRWPFFIEGIVLGLLGAAIAVTILFMGYSSLLDNWQTVMYFMPLLNDQTVLIRCYLALLGSGIILGIMGTSISLNRFLDV